MGRVCGDSLSCFCISGCSVSTDVGEEKDFTGEVVFAGMVSEGDNFTYCSGSSPSD
jgi:hypothetical protein